MMESPNSDRMRPEGESGPLAARGPSPAKVARSVARRRPSASGPDCEPLEGRRLMAASAWRGWDAAGPAAIVVDWTGTAPAPSGPSHGVALTDQAVADALRALDAGIAAAGHDPAATTAERAAVRDGLLAIRGLAAKAAGATEDVPAGLGVAEQVARLKADIKALAQGRTLPDSTLADRIVAQLDEVVATLRFTADDLSVTRIAPAPASSSGGAGTGTTTTHPVTVTPPGTFPTGPIFPSWRTFVARAAGT